MVKIKKLIFILFLFSTPIFANQYPVITDNMLVPGYNSLELHYDQKLPCIAPYPENREEVIPLIKKAEKSENADDSYLIASIFFTGCADLKHKEVKPESQEQCQLSRQFLNKTLKLKPNHGAALYYQATVFENGYGVEKNIHQAIRYYDMACQIKGVRVGAACRQLFDIYMRGKSGVPQDLVKAKVYAHKLADNGSRQFKRYIQYWDYHLFAMQSSKRVDECKAKGTDISICIQINNNELLEYENKIRSAK